MLEDGLLGAVGSSGWEDGWSQSLDRPVGQQWRTICLDRSTATVGLDMIADWLGFSWL
jgi:hypothetical protein